jgi:hypothetical protein
MTAADAYTRARIGSEKIRDDAYRAADQLPSTLVGSRFRSISIT